MVEHKLPTYTFNRDEIEKLSVEAVRKAIEDGTLPISGGESGNIDVSKLPTLTDESSQEELAAAYGKAFVYEDNVFIPIFVDSNYANYVSVQVFDDGLNNGHVYAGEIAHDLVEDVYAFHIHGDDPTYAFVSLSGTKLYRHHVVLSTGDDVYIISNSSTQITSKETLQFAFESTYSAFCSSVDNSAGIVIFMSTGSLYYMDFDLGLTEINLGNISISSDVVTEL